jgi:tetratricopeptide (TPR) repeat protein
MLYYLALCYYNLDIHEDAIELCYQSLGNGFSAEDCHFLLGCIFRELAKYKEAAEHYSECLRINPKNARALSSYGTVMLKTGNDKKALKLINEALQIAPSDDIVLRHMFVYNLSKGRKRNQLNSLQKYLTSENDEVSKLTHIGVFNMHNKNYASARENFRQAFLLDPTNSKVLRLLEEMDILTNWFFIPHRLIQKAGGAGVVYLGFVIIFIATLNIKDVTIHWILIVTYLIFVLYTYLSLFVYRLIKKSKIKSNSRNI